MSDPGNGNGRITVSEDKLRLVLTEFKVELLDELRKYATALVVDALDVRVKALEIWQASQAGAEGERRQVSAATLAYGALIVAALGAVGWLVYYATHT